MPSTSSLASYGAHALERGDFKTAATALRIAASESPNDVAIGKAFAMALVGIQRPNEGLAELVRIAPLAPNDIEIHCNIGELASQVGQWTLALDHLEICLKLDPEAKNGSGVRARMLIRKLQKTVEASVKS